MGSFVNGVIEENDNVNPGVSVNDDDITWPASFGFYANEIACRIDKNRELEGTIGSISITQENSNLKDYGYGWEFTNSLLKATYIPPGAPGEVVSKVYEKLSGQLLLTPAKFNLGSSKVEKIEDNDTKNLILSAGKSTGGYNVLNPVQEKIVNIKNLPADESVKELAYPLNVPALYMDKISSLDNTMDHLFGMCSELTPDEITQNSERIPYCPGMAGYGAYPIIMQIDGSGGFEMWLTNTLSYDEESKAVKNVKPSKNDWPNAYYWSPDNNNITGVIPDIKASGTELVCDDDKFERHSQLFWPTGNAGKAINQEQAFCTPKNNVQKRYGNGSGGAIIILW